LGKIPNIAELGLNCHSEKKQLSLMVMLNMALPQNFYAGRF
jgi:hypothetical protein